MAAGIPWSPAQAFGYAWPAGEAGPLFLFGSSTGTGTTRTIDLTTGTPDFSLSATGTLNTGTRAITGGTWTKVAQGTTTVIDSGTWTGSPCP